VACKRVFPRAAAAPAGWPQPTVPANATLAGCYPYEQRRLPLRAVTLASGAGLPCGLALAAADRPLIGGLGHGLAGPVWGLAVAGRPSSFFTFTVKTQQERVE
ncbi:hypothetical protein BHE74_00046681, partial [Ensete ventricosum]